MKKIVQKKFIYFLTILIVVIVFIFHPFSNLGGFVSFILKKEEKCKQSYIKRQKETMKLY